MAKQKKILRKVLKQDKIPEFVRSVQKMKDSVLGISAVATSILVLIVLLVLVKVE